MNAIMWMVSKLADFVNIISSYAVFCAKRKSTECDSDNIGLKKALCSRLLPVNTNLFKSNHISFGQFFLVLSVSYKNWIVIYNSVYL